MLIQKSWIRLEGSDPYGYGYESNSTVFQTFFAQVVLESAHSNFSTVTQRESGVVSYLDVCISRLSGTYSFAV